MKRYLAIAGLLAGLCALPASVALAAYVEEEDDEKPWQEIEVQMPAATREESWLPFYVSAVAENRFYVDQASISVGSDGVLRYVLIVTTPGGARNVTFEAMRCETKERKIYASGRRDGTWSKSRNTAWERVTAYATVNRQYAALFEEYFCPGGVIVRTAEEAVMALKKGGHPEFTGRAR